MDTIYNEFSNYLEKEHVVVLRTFPELSEQYRSDFLKNYTENTDCLTDVNKFVENNFYTSIISKDDFIGLSDDVKLRVLSYFSQMVAVLLTQSGNIDMSTVENMFDNHKFNIDESQLNTAKDVISKTLGLDNSPMSKIVESMVSDISGTLNTGVPFKDMIEQLSQNFGNKIRDSVSSGGISQEDLESGTRGLFSKLQNITSNPTQMMQTLTGTVPETPEVKSNARQERRRKAREAARAELKQNIKDKERSRKHK